MQERTVDVDGIATRYIEAGEGMPLVLMHGGDFGDHGCAEDWDTVIPGLARHFRVLAYDRIGHGRSDNPRRDADYLIGTIISHLRGFIGALKLGRVHLAGHSRGGYAVTRLALESPELVGGIIMVSSGTLMSRPNPIYRQWDEQAARIADLRERCRFLLAANSFSADHISDRLLDQATACMSLPKTAEAKRKHRDNWENFQADLAAGREETKAWIAAGKLTAPTLIVWGQNDPSAKFDPVGLDCLKLILPAVPGADACILNRAGHYVYRERPAAFVDAVTRFLAAPVET